MLAIFTLSSIPGNRLPDEKVAFQDKWAHLAAYAVGGGLAVHAGFSPIKAFLVTSLYGATDEMHQRFTPRRSCDIADWIADMLGGLLGTILTAYISKKRFASRYGKADAGDATI